MKAMKIVYLYHSIAIKGGLERVLSDKMNYLADNTNFEIYFITSDQGNQEFSYPLSPKIHHTDLGGIKYFSIYKKKYPLRLWLIHKFEKDYRKRLTNRLKEIKPDIIIGNTTLNIALIANLKINAKKILESHLAKDAIIKAGKNHKNINIIEYMLKSIYDKYTYRIINKYDQMVVLTEEDNKAWLNICNTKIIANPLTYYPKIFIKNKKNNTIICAARLYQEKGIDLLIKAWSTIHNKYPSWHIDIYGNGPLYKELSIMSEEYGVDNSIHFFPPTNNIYDKYKEADFMVLSSRYEGFGLVIAEAMSCGTPCVAFNCPSGPNEIITDGFDGLIAQNSDINDLAEKMEWMITHEHERKEMGIKARESAKRYTKEHIMQQWIELFNQITILQPKTK